MSTFAKPEVLTPLRFTVRTSQGYWQRLIIKHPDIEELEELIQLMITPEQQMVERAKQLLERVQQEDLGTLSRNEIMEVITTIAVDKFAHLSREE